jgi:hypothetical protein
MATEINPADFEFERALSSVAPAAATVNPVSAAYAAGMRAGRRGTNRWRMIGLFAAAAAVVPWAVRDRAGPVAAPRADVVVELPVSSGPSFDLIKTADAWKFHEAQLALGAEAIPKLHRPVERRGILEDERF